MTTRARNGGSSVARLEMAFRQLPVSRKQRSWTCQIDPFSPHFPHSVQRCSFLIVLHSDRSSCDLRSLLLEEDVEMDEEENGMQWEGNAAHRVLCDSQR